MERERESAWEYVLYIHQIELLQTNIVAQMNLAFQELYLIVAGIFRKYDLYDGTGMQKRPTLELYETTEADVDLFADYITSGSKPGSKGVRLIIRN